MKNKKDNSFAWNETIQKMQDEKELDEFFENLEEIIDKTKPVYRVIRGRDEDIERWLNELQEKYDSIDVKGLTIYNDGTIRGNTIVIVECFPKD